jgi:hypothetical protein
MTMYDGSPHRTHGGKKKTPGTLALLVPARKEGYFLKKNKKQNKKTIDE